MKKRARPQGYANHVFINCPFDTDYESLFDALIFTIFGCGFIARCALEVDDSSQNRLDKIFTIIDQCKFAIHDLSRTELDPVTRLPRFNMPLELGIFLGAKRYGGGYNAEKNCLILDTERFRYQRFISDISGQDIKPHNNSIAKAVGSLRNWLNQASHRTTIPGPQSILRRYESYQQQLPAICKALHLVPDELTFKDKAALASKWLREYPSK
jgi:hypothetical protein